VSQCAELHVAGWTWAVFTRVYLESCISLSPQSGNFWVHLRIVPSHARRLVGLIYAKEEGTTIVRKDKICKVKDAGSHFRTTESSRPTACKTVNYPVVPYMLRKVACHFDVNVHSSLWLFKHHVIKAYGEMKV
jgi:hypothetical protein